MANKTVKEERTMYCVGPNWEGDGSKQTSACKFGSFKTGSADRYKCSDCVSGLTPEDVPANAAGAKRLEPKKALLEENREPSVGEEIVDGLRELSVNVATGKPLSSEFTVRTVVKKDVASELASQPVEDFPKIVQEVVDDARDPLLDEPKKAKKLKAKKTKKTKKTKKRRRF